MAAADYDALTRVPANHVPLTPLLFLLWDRDRVDRLFGVHLRIEIYTPAAQRVRMYSMFWAACSSVPTSPARS